MRGFTARMSSTSMRSFARALGRKLVRKTSLSAASVSSSSRPSRTPMSRPTLRLPRFLWCLMKVNPSAGTREHQPPALGPADVETAAPLAAVALLHHEVDAADRQVEARGGEPALRVAVHRVLDLDDVRVPGRENRAGGGQGPPQ